ncbi:MAG: translocation/assembly module TamB domain-containing protein [Bacteroidales bacterium]|nr:translocation/assembly module TamB domain-containing protein [Bacteroidales bacterium]
MSVLKRILKITGWTFGLFLAMVIAAFLLLHIPAVQKHLTERVTVKLGSMIGMKVSVGKVYPIFWEGLALKDVSILTEQNDTVLVASGILATLHSVNMDSSYVSLSKVQLNDPDIRVAFDSAGVLNISSILQAFQSSDTTSDICFEIEDIAVRNARFSFNDFTENQHISHGVNFSNIVVSDLFIQAHSFRMCKGTYNLAVDKLSCKEQSGFQLQYLHTLATVCDSIIRCDDITIYTPETKLSANYFEMKYDSFSSFSDFCDKVYLSADLNRTTTTLHDISYFAEPLKDMPYSFSVEGLIEGTVSDFKAKNLHIGYGRSTQFVGNVSATGLPNVDNVKFTVDAQKVETNIFDITHTRIPPFAEEQYVSLPDVLKNLTYYIYVGTVKGSLSELLAKGNLITNAGKLSADACLKQDKTSTCSGTIAFDNFNLSKLLSSSLIGTTTGTLNVDASFNSDSLITAKVVGGLDKIECNDYAYSNLDIDGVFSTRRFFGRLGIDDPNLAMRFGGMVDISKDIPEFRFKSKVQKANLNELHLFEDSLSNVAFSLDVDFQGDKIDDMCGDVSIRDFQYSNARGQVSTKNIALNVSNDGQFRNINLYSAFVDAAVKCRGKYEDLANNLLAIVNRHVSFSPKAGQVSGKECDFLAQVEVKNIDTLFSLVRSDFRIENGSTITAKYVGADTLCDVYVNSPKITFKDFPMYNCDIRAFGSNYNLFLDSRIFLDTIKPRTMHAEANEVKIIGSVKNNAIDLESNWYYDNMLKTKGSLSVLGEMISRGEGNMPKLNMQLRPTNVWFNDSLWNVSGSTVVIDTTSIAITGFDMNKDDKKITVDGIISQNPEDYIVVNVQNYDLIELKSFIKNQNVRLSGPVQGSVRLKNLYATPLVFANVSSSAFTFNEHLLGELKLRSLWENKQKALLMRMSVGNMDTTIAVRGKYVPTTDSLHFDVSLHKLQLETFAEILNGVMNDMAGVANGTVYVDGTMQELQYSGEIDVSDGSMLVDYTNVPYLFSGKLKARKTRFFFTDFVITDPQKNKGQIFGYIDLVDITNPQYVIDVQTSKLLVMKTTAKENDYFYGTIYYDGTAKIEGDLNATTISGQGKTLENTVCSIPVSYSELSGAYDFLYFSNDSVAVPVFEEQNSSSDISINLVVDITPDAQAQIIFDPRVGDVIKARGNGNLQVKMDHSGDLAIYGKYQIEEGDYLFTLKNLINKKLIIQKGGTILWNGDPLNAQVDLLANYETKASPQPLFDSTVSISKRIPVTCQARLQNNLLSPDISYDILVPSSATQVSEVLSTLSEDEKTLQFFSMMLQSAFMSVNSQSGVGGSLSFEVLSNQINNMLSQIDPNMDVSVNYRMGTDNVTNSEFEFGVSRQFWNDRILVNVNGFTDFGGNGSNDAADNQSQSGEFYGNVSVEMKVNKKGTLKVKGFSRSNDDELSEKQGNTNGVGFSFTKNFNTLKDLFRKEE